jgi:hypothetical protein
VDPSSQSSAAHERAAQWIPWLVNGTLPAEQAAALRAHLANCAHCRSDYEAEQRLYETIRGDGPLVFTGESSFAKLMSRIEAQDELVPDSGPKGTEPRVTLSAPVVGIAIATKRRGGRVWHASTLVRALAAAVVIEAVALGVGAWMWQTPQRADGTSHPSAALYQTLAASAPRYGAGPRVRVVFKSSLTLEALQKLLRSVDAHVVDGPTDAQVYTLGFSQPVTAAELEPRLATLRSSTQVLFAEVAAQDRDSR